MNRSGLDATSIPIFPPVQVFKSAMILPSVFQRPRFLALHVLFQTAFTALYWYGDTVLENALLEGSEGISAAIPGNQCSTRFRGKHSFR